MITAGSLEGICWSMGRISSMTSHLSRLPRSLPRHTRQLTLTDKSVVEMQAFLMRGRRWFFIAWKSSRPG